MTTFWASLFGFFTVFIGILCGIFGHKLGAKDKAQEVELAKDSTAKATEARVRDEIASQTKTAASEAASQAATVRADAQAGVSGKTADEINQELRENGWLRD